MANPSIIRDLPLPPEARRPSTDGIRVAINGLRHPAAALDSGRDPPVPRPFCRKPARLRSAASVYNWPNPRSRGLPCCVASGLSLRRLAHCVLPRCSSSRRCGRISSPAATTNPAKSCCCRRPRRRSLHRPSRVSPMPRRRRCPRSWASTRARKCGSAPRSPTIRCCAGTFPTSRSGCRGSVPRVSAPA